ERRLPRVGEPDERGVGHEAELEPEPLLLAVLPLLGEARRAPRVRKEPRVPSAAATAARRNVAVAVTDQVGDDGAVTRLDSRALRDAHHEIVARGPGPTFARTMRARGGTAVRMVPEREQRRDVAIGPQDDVAALAAVAAVRPAAGNVRFAAEGHRPGAAVPAPHVDLRLVDELTHEARIGSVSASTTCLFGM